VFYSVHKGVMSLYHVAAGGGKKTRLTTGRGSDLAPVWQPAGSATAAQQAALPAAAPSTATDDARMVGLLPRAYSGFVTLLAGAIRHERTADLLTGSERMTAFAGRISTRARSLRPSSRRARSVRRIVLRSTVKLKGVAGETRRWGLGLRRGNRRVALSHRNNALLLSAFDVALPLIEAVGEAGASQGSLE